MPIPSPRMGKSPEKESKFIGRCMSDSVMKKEYPKNVQRLAVCYGSWRKKHGGKPPKKESFIMNILRRFKRVKKEATKTNRPRYRFGSIVVLEVFNSLGTLLRQAVAKKFGDKYWVSDYSNKQVVVQKKDSEEYEMVGFKLTKNEIEFVGKLEKVERKIRYESQLSAKDLVDLVDMEREAKKALLENKDEQV